MKVEKIEEFKTNCEMEEKVYKLHNLAYSPKYVRNPIQ